MVRAPAFLSRAPSRRTIGVLLVVASLVPFLRTLGFGYVMDEVTAIRSNPELHGWSAILRVWAHEYGNPDARFEGLYRPLTMSLFAFAWNAGGGWPVWLHLLAIALHAAATVLVWRLMERGVGRVPAVLAALWFAVHPVHVETVANVANSSEALVAIWTCLLAVHLQRSSERLPITWSAAIVTGVLFLAACFSKESGIMSIALAALCVWGWREPQRVAAGPPLAWDQATRTPLARLLGRWQRVLVVCAAAVAILFAVRTLVLGGPLTGEDIAAPGLDGMTTWSRMRAMLSLSPTILRLLVWPPKLNPHYGPSVFGQPGAWLAATVAVLAALVALAAWSARRGDRRPLTAMLWTVIAFLPASNLLVPTGQILAERTLYVPSIGVAMLVGLVLQAAQTSQRAGRAVPGVWPATVALALAVIAFAAARSARWTEVWRTHPSVYAQMIVADSANYRGYWFSAVYAGNNGRMDDALPLLARAYDLFPADRGLKLDYSDALLRQGMSRRAAVVALGLMDSPTFRARPRAVAVYLEALGRAFGPDSVVAAGRWIMARTPSSTAALYVGQAHQLRREWTEAARAYREGLRLSPTDSVLAVRLKTLEAAH